MQNKEKARQHYFEIRRNLAPEYISAAGRRIEKNILALKEIQQASAIMVYISYRNEVKTRHLLAELLPEKRIYVPYCLTETREMGIARICDLERDLEKGAYNILEPREEIRNTTSPLKLDVVIVPGIVFSREGYRVGYGGGYYDRFLEKLMPDTITIGLTYNKLLVKLLPVEKHDKKVDMIITEQEIIHCEKDG